MVIVDAMICADGSWMDGHEDKTAALGGWVGEAKKEQRNEASRGNNAVQYNLLYLVTCHFKLIVIHSCFYDHHLISSAPSPADRPPASPSSPFPSLQTEKDTVQPVQRSLKRPDPSFLLLLPSLSLHSRHASKDASTLSKASSEPRIPGLLTVSTRLSPAT